MKKLLVILTICSLSLLSSCGKKEVEPKKETPTTPMVENTMPTGASSGTTITPPSPPQIEIAKPVTPAPVPETSAPKVEIKGKVETPKVSPVATPPSPPVVAPVKPVEVKTNQPVVTQIPKEETTPLNDTPVKTTEKK